MIQICSGITSGRMLNGELYAQRLQKLISYLHLLTGCFMKNSRQSSAQKLAKFARFAKFALTVEENLHKTACRQMQIT